ncbi:MAG: glycosyl transferase [Alphaproteobacteria bacterium]|nr:MAG: glycosyl transferase [Alphaproteobacteria bacterium]
MSRSVLFHVQYLLGIGHLQRSLRIANALARDGIDVTLVCGGPPITELPADPSIKFVQLAPVRARDARFELIDGAGRPLDDALREKRRADLLAAFATAEPDAVIIEGFPFARRAFRFELDPLIEAVRTSEPRPCLICSVRDIVVMREDPARHRETVARVRRDFDAVLVHGDPALIRFEASFPTAPQIADRLIYTGYVSPPHLTLPIADATGPLPLPPEGRRGQFAAGSPEYSLSALRGGEGWGEVGEPVTRGEVIVSAGGGAAGRALLDAALTARREGCLADLPWRLLTGTNLPESEVAALRRSAPAGVTIERFRPDLAGLLRHCRVSVSQAGYNTVLDILAARARAVLVPFAAERETEQLMRAERLQALGAAELVRESELSPQSLAAAIERAAARKPAPITVNLDGAANSARLIAGLIEGYPAGDLAAGMGTVMIGQ